MDDLHFAIATKLPSVQLDKLPRQEHLSLLPAMIESLDDIRRVDVNTIAEADSWTTNGTISQTLSGTITLQSVSQRPHST